MELVEAAVFPVLFLSYASLLSASLASLLASEEEAGSAAMARNISRAP